MKTYIYNLSLVINTKNEEKNIMPCIKSVGSLANEIIVVDMNSTDQTVSLAKKAGAKVYSSKDFEYVEPARNLALSKATNEWILLLDADERLTKELKTLIKKIIQDNKYDTVAIPRKNIILGKWIRHTGWWPDYQIRLFKKGYVHFSDVIHSQPEYKGEKLTLEAKEKNAIIHHQYNTIVSFITMINKYTTVSTNTNEGNFFANHTTLSPDLLLRYYESEFNYRYFESYGYLDGIHGFVLSKLREFYKFIEFAKHWEQQNYSEIVNSEELHQIMLKRRETNSNQQLQEIKSSKFYKTWRIYCQIKDYLKNLRHIF